MSYSLFFYGKLRKTREFLVSSSLSSTDRNFWDSWFNRCGNGNQLMPFLAPKISSNTIWLFLVRYEDNIYIGLGSQSQDLTGRNYPFLVFNQLVLGKSFTKEFHQYLEFYLEFIDEFDRILNQGYIEVYSEFENKCPILDSTNVNEDYKNEISNILLTNIEQEKYTSNWYDIKTSKYIIHPNALTCSLYTKVFG